MALCRILITACLITLAPVASALSCKSPDLAKRMEEAKASSDVYYVLSGTFTPTSAAPAREPYNPLAQHTKKPPVTVRTLFNGVSLTGSPAPNFPISNVPVDVKTSCIMSWCSSVPSQNKNRIAFVLAKPGQAPLLEIAPCSDYIFSISNDGKEISLLRSCFDRPCLAINNLNQ